MQLEQFQSGIKPNPHTKSQGNVKSALQTLTTAIPWSTGDVIVCLVLERNLLLCCFRLLWFVKTKMKAQTCCIWSWHCCNQRVPYDSYTDSFLRSSGTSTHHFFYSQYFCIFSCQHVQFFIKPIDTIITCLLRLLRYYELIYDILTPLLTPKMPALHHAPEQVLPQTYLKYTRLGPSLPCSHWQWRNCRCHETCDVISPSRPPMSVTPGEQIIML